METNEFTEQMTVKDMADYLNMVIESGFGDYKILCVDGILHKSDIGLNFSKKHVVLRGHLFNEDKFKKVKQLENDIKKAIEKYIAQ